MIHERVITRIPFKQFKWFFEFGGFNSDEVFLVSENARIYFRIEESSIEIPRKKNLKLKKNLFILQTYFL